MRPLSPRDNAFFLQTWRERMRRSTVYAAGAVAAFVVALIIVGCYSTDRAQRPTGLWPGWAFGIVAIFQGVVLLVLGSYSAGLMAARERSGGTLDFHRISPTRRIDQLLGLVFGAPALEWCVFAWSLPVSLVLAVGSGARVGTFVGFYVSLVICAILFHSLAVAAGLARGGSRTVGKGSAVGLLPAITLFVWSYLSLGILASAFFHATSLPSYMRLLHEAFSRPGAWPWADEILFTFCRVRLPSLVLQMMVQVPLIALAWIIAIRIISRPGRPILSKRQILAGVGLFLFFLVGSVVWVPAGWHTHLIAGWFLYFAVLLGLFGAAGVTPKHLLHLKGLRRMRKLGRRRLGVLDDQASNWAWLAAYAGLVTAAYTALAYCLPETSTFVRLAALVVSLSYVAWFAGALECFRLSRYRAFRSLFALAVATLWLFVPMFGLFASWLGDGADYPTLLWVASPLFGLGMVTFAFEPDAYGAFLPTALAVNVALAGLMLFLAARERRRCAREALGSAPADGDHE